MMVPRCAVALSLLLFSLLVCTKTAEAKYNIAIVPKMRAAWAFYNLTLEGCQDKAASLEDVECVFAGSWEPNITENIRILYELIDDPEIDAISVSVLDGESYTPVINECIAKGKPIITFDSDAPQSNRLAYTGTNNYEMGMELGKLLKQIKPDGGTYGIVSALGPDGSEEKSPPNLQERVQGVRDSLGAEDSLWVEVSNSPLDGKEDTKESLARMWDLVEENPGIGAVVSVVGLPMFDENTTAWKSFVDTNRDVLTIIADTLPVQLELMQRSYVDALVGQLPYNMGYQSAETLVQVLDRIKEGVPLQETLTSDIIYGTHQLEVLRIPLDLPPLDFDENHIESLAIVGYVLGAVIILTSFGFMGWTWFNRNEQVVKSSQPIFLIMICLGTLLMGAAIIPLGIDDQKSQEAADIACMVTPWFTFVGFTVAFSALLAKTWRLNKIFLSSNPLRKIKVTEIDVMMPFVVMLALNIIVLTCWTVIDPIHFERILEGGTDPWNRPLGSYGQCRNEDVGDSIPYLVLLAIINVAALMVANFQAYRARNVRTEFNESGYVAMANASILQAIVVCVPIIFLTRESPDAFFIVLSAVLFIIPAAILACIFVPKILALKSHRKSQGLPKQPSVRVSGFTAMDSSMNQSRKSIYSGVDNPVSALLADFQALSWSDKTKVLSKLAPQTSGMDSRTSPGSSNDMVLIPKRVGIMDETEKETEHDNE